MSKLLVPVGIPGCGKSTFVQTLLDDHTIVSTDKIRKFLFGSLRAAHDVSPEQKRVNNAEVFEVFHTALRVALESHQDAIADATNLHRYARATLLELGHSAGAQVICILFKNPDEAVYRNHRREEDAIVPKDQMLDFMAQYYEALKDIPQEDFDGVIEIAGTRF